MAHNPELQYHIQMKAGDVGRYVFLPGDPGRCEKIAKYFDNPQEIAYNREYKTYTGTLLGTTVSVMSTGIGCPSTAIGVEELIKIGADTFIRIGTSGGMQPGTNTGDVAIVNSAIRDEGTTLHYMPAEFPALADIDVVASLRSGAEKIGIPYRVGPTQSKDSFFGEVEPDRMPVSDRLKRRWKAWIAGGAICSEMEAAAIFIISAIHRTRAGGVMLMASMEENEDPIERQALWDVDRAIRVAVEGLKILIEQDKQDTTR